MVKRKVVYIERTKYRCPKCLAPLKTQEDCSEHAKIFHHWGYYKDDVEVGA